MHGDPESSTGICLHELNPSVAGVSVYSLITYQCVAGATLPSSKPNVEVSSWTCCDGLLETGQTNTTLWLCRLPNTSARMVPMLTEFAKENLGA
jgi:hypothetical protein